MDKYINPIHIAKLVIEGLGEAQGCICLERAFGKSSISFTRESETIEMTIGKKSDKCVVRKIAKRESEKGKYIDIEYTKALAAGLNNKEVALFFIEVASL